MVYFPGFPGSVQTMVEKQVITCQNGTFAPPAPINESQEGALAPISGIPVWKQ